MKNMTVVSIKNQNDSSTESFHLHGGSEGEISEMKYLLDEGKHREALAIAREGGIDVDWWWEGADGSSVHRFDIQQEKDWM